jgi:transposase
MNSERRGRYDEEFRRNAVELLIKSKRPMRQIASELGVSGPTLREWKRRYVQDPSPEGQVRVRKTLRDLEEDNRRLRQQNLLLAQQRDILKKAMGILSEPSRSGMP